MSGHSVSIIVPARDAVRWIADTLASVLGQTCDRNLMQIVLVDDGSQDATVDVARSVLEGSGVAHAILRQDASGPSRARNRGWQAADAPWIQFLDADDLLAPTKIATQLQAAVAERDVAVLYSPWTRIVETSGRWQATHPPVDPSVGEDAMLDLLRSSNFLQLGCALFSRTWLERVGGFDESRAFIEDVDLLLRIAHEGGHVSRIPSATPLSFYRQHAGSLSRSNDERFVEGCVRNARFADAVWSRDQAITTARAAVLAEVYLDAARYYAGGNRARFDELFDRVEQLRPDLAPSPKSATGLLARLVGARRAEWSMSLLRRARKPRA